MGLHRILDGKTPPADFCLWLLAVLQADDEANQGCSLHELLKGQITMESTVPISPALSPHSLTPNNRYFSPDSYSLQFSSYTDPNPFNFTSAFKANNFQTAAQGVSFAPPQYGGLVAIEDVKSRFRNMSQSSTDGEDLNDVKPLRKGSVAVGDDMESNRLKRKSSDALDYPRRRATIAVSFGFFSESLIIHQTTRKKMLMCNLSAKSVGRENHDATELVPSAGYVRN